jgi:RimJ/RimL family protein N-acetyltransferase
MNVILTLNEDENSIRIVPISEQHITGFHKCLDSVARERKYIGFTQAPPLESTREFILSNIEKNVPQFVALKGDEVIGWCDVSPRRGEGLTHRGRLGMGVLEDYRRQGVGTKLLDRVITVAKEQGLERIELEVYASNTPAINLYEKWGFNQEGVMRRARKIDGVYDDIIVMALLV